ncbi:MAG TPA: M6 family metalloprotease domain-containing protein, partial [Gemmataceae bacterium]|nr:M6 family metalloprotease domain-containing protein [Gemmataceae bacterium]
MSSLRISCGRLAALVVAAWSAPALAMPPRPDPIIETQPDGTKIALRLLGNESVNWKADLNGYPVERMANGAFAYVPPDVAPPNQQPLLVGKADPAALGIKKGMPPRPGVPNLQAPDRLPSPAGSAPEQRVAPAGMVKNVVILMKFSNHTTRTLPSVPDLTKLFNAPGGDPVMAPSGSVRDVYLANSYGKFDLTSTVFAWVTLPKSESYYANGDSGMSSRMHEAITDALNLADPMINFSQFDKDGDKFVDAITFLHSGYGAEWGGTDSSGAYYKDRIWSHRWEIPTWTSAEGVKVSPYHISPALWDTSGSAPGRIGVICHETGHFFGMPDLYDGTTGAGVGAWCMMSNSWGFDGSQLYPPHFSAWCKTKLGWVTPTELTKSGVYTAPASAASATVFKVSTGFPSGEYLLIENRQATGFDRNIPGGTGGKGGLAVWHIDEKKGVNTDGGYPGQAGWPTNNKHYMVALLQADGKYDMEKDANRGDGDDLFRAGFKVKIDGSTVPNTHRYQDGMVSASRNDITEISASGTSMTFR